MVAPLRPALAGVLLLGAALAVGAGCGQRETDPCPGVPLATMQLHGVLVSSDCAAPPADWPWAPRSAWGLLVPATIPPDPDPTDATVPSFAVSWRSTGGDGLAYCSGGSRAEPLLGALTGTHAHVDRVIGGGAVLSGCAATCQLDSTLVVDGALTGDPPTAFSGTLTETLGNPAGGCGACILPCTSTYSLSGGTQ
jgi:hypothetical protein